MSRTKSKYTLTLDAVINLAEWMVIISFALTVSILATIPLAVFILQKYL